MEDNQIMPHDRRLSNQSRAGSSNAKFAAAIRPCVRAPDSSGLWQKGYTDSLNARSGCLRPRTLFLRRVDAGRQTHPVLLRLRRRSAMAVQAAQDAGLNARHIQGGIDAYAKPTRWGHSRRFCHVCHTSGWGNIANTARRCGPSEFLLLRHKLDVFAQVVRFNERQQGIALLDDGFNASRHLVPAVFGQPPCDFLHVLGTNVWRVSRANAGARRGWGGHWIAKRFYQLRRRFCMPRPVSELAHISAIMLGAQPASIPDLDGMPMQCCHDLINALESAGFALVERNTKDVAQACSRHGLHARLVIDVDRALDPRQR